MYVPKPFDATDRQALHALERGHSLSTAVLPSQAVLQALHVRLPLSEAQGGQAAVTGNGMAIHLHGILRAVAGGAWLHVQLRPLSGDQQAGRPHSWHGDGASPAYAVAHRHAIEGVETPVNRLIGTFTLSQNQPEPTIDGVIHPLHHSQPPASRCWRKQFKRPQRHAMECMRAQ